VASVARRPESFGHHEGHADVHCPGEIRIARGAKLVPGHEHDVFDRGQAFERCAVEQIAGDALDVL